MSVMTEVVGRARLSELFEPMSSALGIPVKTVFEISKHLRINGYLPAARARKLGTAHVGPDEAATLLLGVAGSHTIHGSTDAVSRLSEMRLAGISARYINETTGVITEQPMPADAVPFEDLATLYVTSFGKALSELILRPNHTGIDGVMACPISFTVSRTRRLASLTMRYIPTYQIDVSVEAVLTYAGTEDTVGDIEAGNFPPEIERIHPFMDVSAFCPCTVLLALNEALSIGATDQPTITAKIW
jgi:hypothetical protein